MSEGVLVDYNDGVAHVRLNWPEKKNALNAAMLGILSAADHIRNDLPVRAVVLSDDGGSRERAGVRRRATVVFHYARNHARPVLQGAGQTFLRRTCCHIPVPRRPAESKTRVTGSTGTSDGKLAVVNSTVSDSA
jgi:hypothetical protein